jgi:TonB family protein
MSTAIARSTLNPEPQPLALSVLAALILHVTVVLMILCAGMWEPRRKPLLDDHAMEVSMMVLPKSDSRMPERAQRAPRVSGDQAKAKEPTPIRESDLTVNQPDAPDTKGADTKTNDREAALRDMLMSDALDDLPEGPTDRDASDPTSTSDEAINVSGAGKSDPELARYIAQLQKLFNQHFNPLPAIVQANPDLKCKILVRVDESGAVTGYDIVGPSGNDSFDRAAESAVQAVSNIPPPPEKYRAQAADGYTIVFQK